MEISEIYSKLLSLGFPSNIVSSFENIVVWFREEHQIYLAVLPFREKNDIDNHVIGEIFEESTLRWYASVVDDYEQEDILCNENDLGCHGDLCDSYHEAQLDMVNQAIEILENR